MSLQPDKYLLPEEDGLDTRPSHQYAKYKFKAVQTYLTIANTALRKKSWRNRYYIDLQAGPGKNRNKDTSEISLGSPLIALTVPYPSTKFRFNELDKNNYQALETRVLVSSLYPQIKIYQDDANKIVNNICDEIEQDDRQKLKGKGPTLNIAFLDPEGLELNWTTIERLARVQKMDLIINFSTRGILGCLGAGLNTRLDQFFGTQEWRNINSQQPRAYVDLYLSSLKKFGYYIEVDEEYGEIDEIVVRNSKNAEVYRLIYASKHPLGNKFWGQTTKSTLPPRFPGF